MPRRADRRSASSRAGPSPPSRRPGLGAFLPALADAFGGVALGVQAVDAVEAVGETAAVAEEARADLPPGRRDQAVLDVRPQDAEKRRRLVELVDESHRNE